MDSKSEVKTCCVDGCDQPRMRRAAGTYHPRCTAHMREYWNKASHGELDRSKKGVCMVEGCNEERHHSKGGFAYQYCESHQKAHQKGQNRKNLDKKRAARNGVTEAQAAVGFDADPDKAAKKLAVQQTVRLMLIDYDADEEVYIEGKVTLRCPTHRDALQPGGYEGLLERHIDLDYIVAERGAPPSTSGIQSALDWRD